MVPGTGGDEGHAGCGVPGLFVCQIRSARGFSTFAALLVLGIPGTLAYLLIFLEEAIVTGLLVREPAKETFLAGGNVCAPTCDDAQPCALAKPVAAASIADAASSGGRADHDDPSSGSSTVPSRPTP